MERTDLINVIIKFCIEYKLFDNLNKEDEIKSRIESQLDDVSFIENLINTIIVKTRNCEKVDNNKIKHLLLELEKVRLELEYINGRG